MEFFRLLQKNALDRIAIVTWFDRTYRRRRQAGLGRLTAAADPPFPARRRATGLNNFPASITGTCHVDNGGLQAVCRS